MAEHPCLQAPSRRPGRPKAVATFTIDEDEWGDGDGAAKSKMVTPGSPPASVLKTATEEKSLETQAVHDHPLAAGTKGKQRFILEEAPRLLELEGICYKVSRFRVREEVKLLLPPEETPKSTTWVKGEIQSIKSGPGKKAGILVNFHDNGRSRGCFVLESELDRRIRKKTKIPLALPEPKVRFSVNMIDNYIGGGSRKSPYKSSTPPPARRQKRRADEVITAATQVADMGIPRDRALVAVIRTSGFLQPDATRATAYYFEHHSKPASWW